MSLKMPMLNDGEFTLLKNSSFGGLNTVWVIEQLLIDYIENFIFIYLDF